MPKRYFQRQLQGATPAEGLAANLFVYLAIGSVPGLAIIEGAAIGGGVPGLAIQLVNNPYKLLVLLYRYDILNSKLVIMIVFTGLKRGVKEGQKG